MKNKNIRTQSELAKKLGITKNQLSVMLSEKNSPFKSNIQLLSKTLEVSPLEIITSVDLEGIDSQVNGVDQNKEYVDVTTVVAHRRYNVLELFAGTGGLASGLEKAGFNTVGLVEIDKYAAESLRINRPSWNVIEGDIIEVANRGIYNYLPPNIEIDLLSGGYPCQSFSYAGQKKGLDDVRGTMFYYYASILEQIMPKMFLAENVKGLTTHDGGKTLKTMISIFESIGYRVTYHILKANDYNVAQKRERTVIVGIRNDINEKYFLPKPYAYKPVLRDA
ncbi:MAG: DNA (cytosine-5-)-methyltransferase, partial [Vallitaleaceae bacterium]|nr:DNA (cytosine-5-)-methyltransferase [Vallitaleaceae bacterium]